MRRFSRRDFNPFCRNLLNLVEQRPRVNHHAIADHRQLARPQDARWQKRQLVGHAINHQRMAGIVPALVAHHRVGTLRQPVHNLAFALVAPLCADNCYIRHMKILTETAPKT